MGIFNPILSAIHPQELSPKAMPTIATENIKPNTSGSIPIAVKYRGRMGRRMLIARAPSPRIAIITNLLLTKFFIQHPELHLIGRSLLTLKEGISSTSTLMICG
jgi:hypothetical protein